MKHIIAADFIFKFNNRSAYYLIARRILKQKYNISVKLYYYNLYNKFMYNNMINIML